MYIVNHLFALFGKKTLKRSQLDLLFHEKVTTFYSKDEKIPGPEPKKPFDVESMIQMVYKCVHCPKGKAVEGLGTI